MCYVITSLLSVHVSVCPMATVNSETEKQTMFKLRREATQ